MTELYAHGRSLPEAYHDALKHLYNWSTIVDDASHNTRCKECSMTMVVREPLAEPMISRCVPCGPAELEQYRMEMLDGIMDFCVGRGWDYTYHERIAPQIPRIIQMLKQDGTTRQAFIDVRRPDDIYRTDPPCLTSVFYMIRDGKLDCSVLFRSNDAVKATFMNAFALICLQKRIADKLGVGVGTYTHRANSFHAYERDWPLLSSYVDRIYAEKDLTYRYVGDWDEQMKEAEPEIFRKVDELKWRNLKI